MGILDINLTLNDITLLGLLNEKELGYTGSQLEDIINVRNMRIWTKIGKSSIYSTLKKLEKRNFVNVKEQYTIHERKTIPPVREKYYSITKKGKTNLINALTTILTTNVKIIDPFDISLAFLYYVAPEERKKAIDERLNQISKRKTFLEHQTKKSKDPILFLLFSKPLSLVKAEEEWIKNFYDKLTK